MLKNSVFYRYKQKSFIPKRISRKVLFEIDRSRPNFPNPWLQSNLAANVKGYDKNTLVPFAKRVLRLQVSVKACRDNSFVCKA